MSPSNQYGKPAHEGDSPSKGGLSPSRGFFSLCITIYRRKNQNCKKQQWCLWVWRFTCPLSMHKFIEISISALEKKFKHFDVERPVKVCAPTGLSRAPPAKLSGQLSSQAPYKKKKNFRGFPYETPTMPVVYRRSSRCFNEKKNLVRKYKHTLILCDYSKIDIRFSEEI